MWTTWIVPGDIIVTVFCHVIVYFGTGSQMRHSLIKGVERSHLFSVRAVRLKWRMSWWRGSGFVSFSSSSSSFSSIAFYVIENKNLLLNSSTRKNQTNRKCFPQNVFHTTMYQLFLLMWEHIQTGHQSFCPQRNILRFGSRFACTHLGTCYMLYAWKRDNKHLYNFSNPLISLIKYLN